jgi:hypothetical protein
MDILAFLPAAIAAAMRKPEVAKASSRPSFKPRFWYHRNRLDARPVIWSMDNHPEEWEAYSIWSNGKDRVTGRRNWYQLGYMLHIPSNHKFCVDRGSTAYLASAPGLEPGSECGCRSASRGRLQPFHSMAIKDAASRWFDKKFPEPVLDHEHFKSHFLHDA